MTKQEFIERSEKVHEKGKYIYKNLPEKIKWKDKVEVYCTTCKKYFFQVVNTHLCGSGCPTCGRRSTIDSKRDTTESFIKKAKEKYGNLYKYDKVVYKDSETPVNIWCNTCQKYFEVTPHFFLSNSGCPYCSKSSRGIKRAKTTKDFVEELKVIHGDKYSFNKTIYKNNSTKVCIFCKSCQKYFWASPKSLLKGSGCPICGLKKRVKSRTKTQETFIEDCIKKYKDKYSYERVEYKNSSTKVEIFCKKCQEYFSITPNDFLDGHECPKCSRKRQTEELYLTTKEFIKRAKEIHGNLYDYKEVNYTGYRNKIKIWCNTCKKFFYQIAGDHLSGKGCQSCYELKNKQKFLDKCEKIYGKEKFGFDKLDYKNISTPVIIYDFTEKEYFSVIPSNFITGTGNPKNNVSSGENFVKTWLEFNNLDFIIHNKIVWENRKCRNKDFFIVDFYLTFNDNIYILEYHGKQHYVFVEYFYKTEDDFVEQLQRDINLMNYCKEFNIKLIEIPYTINSFSAVSEFLDKTILQGIDPNTLVDYNKLYK